MVDLRLGGWDGEGEAKVARGTQKKAPTKRSGLSKMFSLNL